ncbi:MULTISPECIES: efflux RND transporter periplasmic adaptor subunit [unclassified Cyanobium]|uniref:efflux RND transporter periplasmic adaptor subunit n=1 Tax=unclassified Cyanobium TaxID=2627006 RepID=UPI0020CEC42A|nr:MULTISPECIES: efflux RND transporter periplasmic adaptor subunit [unclassified Cyanobium]MCP9860555.1 efflux RND transporter periplasmic adaptor subunit [Cyanobium sp. Cruz-8H5]MCP9867638.1 efflux RND transporter periplasmic adaptor subunit [Cyanobium sp. Cruz-8D1]
MTSQRPATRHRRPWWLALAGAALLVVALSQRVGPLAPEVLEVARPERLPMQPGLVGIGRVEARRTHQLSSVVSARLLSLAVGTGDRVQQGQLLGLLDPVDLPQRLSAARAVLQASRQQSAAAAAQWRQTQATLTYVASNTARFERLAAQGAVSDDALLERRQSLAQARAGVATTAALHQAARSAERQAAADLAALEAQRQSLRLVAPADGLVLRRLVDPGSTVVPGQVVLEIADPGQFWIDVRFDQRQATGLAPGQPATVEFRRLQGQRVAGVVERIEPTADSLTEDMRAKVRLMPGALAAAGLTVSLGELAEVRVALPAANDALAIPAQSLRRRRDDLGVWLAGDGGLVFAPLRLGRHDAEGRVEVLGGLEPGARLLLQPPADPAGLRRYRLQTTSRQEATP